MDPDDLEYEENSGNFLVKRDGYYQVSGHLEVKIHGDTSGTLTQGIYKEGDNRVSYFTMNRLTSNQLNTPLIGTAYFKKGEVIRIMALYDLADFEVIGGHISIIYLGNA